MGTTRQPTENTTAAVYRAVLEMVLGGTLLPGSKINQAVVAEQLEVSFASAHQRQKRPSSRSLESLLVPI